MNPQPKRRWTLGRLATWAGSIATALSILVGAVWTASADRATIRSRGETNEAKIADHEKRLRDVEEHLGQIAGDVRWIRETMEKK